ncbi:hypothetical protein GJ496_011541 [Pomphorhynchus laevis]|nr:hypothetical protein GJ496_011541 [Pomphorhynchus laevis]
MEELTSEATGNDIASNSNELLCKFVNDYPTLDKDKIQLLLDWPDQYPPFCKLCNIIFSHSNSSRCHFKCENGFSHWENIRFQDSVKNNCITDYCLPCNMLLNSNSATHFTGRKHLKKIKTKKEIVLMNEIYSKILEIKQPNWYKELQLQSP